MGLLVFRPAGTVLVGHEPGGVQDPQVRIAEARGSASPMATPGFLARSACATPASVPPEPTAQMKPSTLPPVCAQISGPVPSAWACRLATLSNWLAQNAPAGSLLASCSAR